MSESPPDSMGKASVQRTEKDREGRKFESLDVFDSSNSATRQTLFSDCSEQPVNGEGEWDPQRDVYSLGCALLHPTHTSQQGA